MPPQPADADVVRIVDAYMATTAAVRARVIAYVEATWRTLGNYRDADIAKFVAAVVPVVEAGQRSVASLTDAYLASVATRVLGNGKPVGIARTDITGLRGTVTPTEVYSRAGHVVWRALHDGVPYGTAVERGLTRAVDLAATDVQLAKRKAAQVHVMGDNRVVGYRRVLEGAHNCGLCIVASTQRYHKGDLLPIHPACVTGDSLILAKDVVAITRRWHTDGVVVIRTASGDDMTVTANHPVLTDRGWLPAALIGEGDNVVRDSRRNRVIGRGPREDNRPARAEDVWRSVAVAGDLVRVPFAAEDFHGDATNSEVDIVFPDSNLAAIRGTTFGQPARETALVPGHGWGVLLAASGAARSLVPGRHAADAGLISGGALGTALLGGHPSSANQPGTTPVTRFDAPTEEFSLESAPVYAQRGLDLIRRLAGEISLDRVVEATRVGWAGHVYNLHTAEGWYSANSHIVSNCDCGVLPIYGRHDPGQIIDEQSLEGVHSAIQERFGVSDRGGRAPIDYRKVLLVRQHGELGPVLTVKSQEFTGPADLAA